VIPVGRGFERDAVGSRVRRGCHPKKRTVAISAVSRHYNAQRQPDV
jgi:hypothetical protein